MCSIWGDDLISGLRKVIKMGESKLPNSRQGSLLGAFQCLARLGFAVEGYVLKIHFTYPRLVCRGGYNIPAGMCSVHRNHVALIIATSNGGVVRVE